MKQLSETLNPSIKDLRVFAGLQFPFFCIISGILFRQGVSLNSLASMLCGSFAIGVAGVAKPNSIRPIYIAWMLAVFPIGWTVSHLLMAMIYYLVVTPIGLWRTRVSGDPLHREFDLQRETYWEERNTERTQESYFRQF